MEHVSVKEEIAEKAEHEHTNRKMSFFGHLFRFLGWWFGFSGLYSMFAVCPFCGQPACPVGLASAGSVGAFLSLCVLDWRLLFRFLKQRLLGKISIKRDAED
jgi:hypothetical protein